MNYIPVGRKLLKVFKSDLNNRDFKIFVSNSKTEKFSEVYTLGKRGGVPEKHIINDPDVKIEIPIITIGFPVNHRKGYLSSDTLTEVEFNNPSMRNRDTNIVACSILDNVSYNKYVEAISRIEDSEIFACLQTTVSDSHTITPNNGFGLPHINFCISLIEEHECKAKNMLIHPQKYREMLSWGIDVLGKESCDEIIKTGNLSKILDIKINVSNRIDKRHIYLLADEEEVGELHVKKDNHLIGYFNNNTKTIEFVMEEEVGVCILRDYCISKISCSY